MSEPVSESISLTEVWSLKSACVFIIPSQLECSYLNSSGLGEPQSHSWAEECDHRVKTRRPPPLFVFIAEPSRGRKLWGFFDAGTRRRAPGSLGPGRVSPGPHVDLIHLTVVQVHWGGNLLLPGEPRWLIENCWMLFFFSRFRSAIQQRHLIPLKWVWLMANTITVTLDRRRQSLVSIFNVFIGDSRQVTAHLIQAFDADLSVWEWTSGNVLCYHNILNQTSFKEFHMNSVGV